MAQTDFNSLKKNRTKTLDKLNSQLEKISTKSYSDPNAGKFWKPTKDKAGNGFAVIRFLPASVGEEMPFVRIWDHGFQGPTGLWYIENSLTTLNQDDPDNDGKVFMYQFGKKIFDKLNDLMNPTFEDEAATNPFDFWEGANFRLKIRKFEGYPNYDKSEFDPASPLLEDDDALEGVWKNWYLQVTSNLIQI